MRTSIGGQRGSQFGQTVNIHSPLKLNSGSPVKLVQSRGQKTLNYNKIQNDTADEQLFANDSPNVPVPNKPIQGFGDYEKHIDENAFSGQLFLKTKTERLKEHWGQLSGNELYFYRKQGDTEHRLMHILTGTFIKEMASEHSEAEDQDIYPIKIVLPPNKSQIGRAHV